MEEQNNCQRCSYCCYYLNSVVSPKYSHLEEIDFDSDLPEDFFIDIVDENTKCPHLSWDKEKDIAVCKIHNKNWYKNTTCYRHNNKKCKIGIFIRQNHELLTKYRERALKND